MIALKLHNRNTGEIVTIARDSYGIIMEKFIKLVPAIADGWFLYIENKLGIITQRSDTYEV